MCQNQYVSVEIIYQRLIINLIISDILTVTYLLIPQCCDNDQWLASYVVENALYSKSWYSTNIQTIMS